jgi:transcriptional regulator with XRE-family HTH domain
MKAPATGMPGTEVQINSRDNFMGVCERLREIRIQKKLSQGDIEARTGLLRCYVSRVENGHTVPSIETLEKFPRALGVPMYETRVGNTNFAVRSTARWPRYKIKLCFLK